MVDFRAAFNEGIKAAELAERSRSEIDEVFRQLNRDLEAATQGSIGIKRQLMEGPSEWGIETYSAIIASNKAFPQRGSVELARWNQPAEGYPCTLAFGGDEVFCENREGLERALVDLLSDSVTGTALYRLMKDQPGT